MKICNRDLWQFSSTEDFLTELEIISILNDASVACEYNEFD